MDRQILEKLYRKELNRNGQRWSKSNNTLSDAQMIRFFGALYVRRIVSEEETAILRQTKSGEYTPPECDLEIAKSNGTLHHNAGGGKRNIRGTNSF